MSDTQQMEEQRAAQIEAAMEEAGVPSTEDVFEDYFGFGDERAVTLPDGKSFIQFKVMNEGDRKQYLNAQNRKVTIKKGSGDAEMQLSPGDDKYNLLRITIIGWNLRRGGQAVPFSKRTLQEFLETANPKVIDIIHKEITLAHPWLLDEMTLEDIDQQIEDLQAMREVVERREAGK